MINKEPVNINIQPSAQSTPSAFDLQSISQNLKTYKEQIESYKEVIQNQTLENKRIKEKYSNQIIDFQNEIKDLKT